MVVGAAPEPGTRALAASPGSPDLVMIPHRVRPRGSPSIPGMTHYAETVLSRRSWGILVVIVAVVELGVLLYARAAPDTFTWWVLLPFGIIGAIAALTMWSVGFYGNIRLTQTHLRVGRKRLALSELDPWSVSGPGEPVRGQVVGGAYAPTLGTRVVGVEDRLGRQLIVQTKDPAALRTALEAALEPYRRQS